MKSRDLLPKDKGDIETAHKLRDYTFEDVKSIVPELLIWLQDLHWPIAGTVGEYLESISQQITNEIIEVLDGTDEEWKSNCIVVFGFRATKPLDLRLKATIEKIACNPTYAEIEAHTHRVAKEFLKIK